jgi:hypothetical protein
MEKWWEERILESEASISTGGFGIKSDISERGIDMVIPLSNITV